MVAGQSFARRRASTVVCLRITMYPTMPEPTPPEKPPPPDDSGGRWEATVLRTVAGLNTLAQDAVRLIYQHGLTQAQVAAQLGVAESIVRAEVAGAFRALAASLLRPESRTR
jgi:DNA-directed RNA polymerase specialized sigma24 family protein